MRRLGFGVWGFGVPGALVYVEPSGFFFFSPVQSFLLEHVGVSEKLGYLILGLIRILLFLGSPVFGNSHVSGCTWGLRHSEACILQYTRMQTLHAPSKVPKKRAN